MADKATTPVDDHSNEVLRKSAELSTDGAKYDLRMRPIPSPAYRSSFGDHMTESLTPVTKLSAQYGILENVETFTATGGSVGTEDNMFKCTTGTNVGGYGVIRTAKPTIYREGQGLMARFTARFDSNAVASSLQFAGLFNVQDTIAFGYRGTTFGILFDNYGAQEQRKLTITGAGNGTLTLTLNSVEYSIPVTTGTVQHNAYEIEAWMAANQSVWNVEQVDDEVLFQSKNVGAKSGTYSISGSGMTGSFTAITTGAAQTNSTIAQADWNGESLPSDFDSTKGNVYMIKVSYLGFGPISFYVLHPDKRIFVLVHTIDYQNANTKPSISNVALKIGWTAASLGSTTDLSVYGASGATFIEGESKLLTESHAQSNENTSVSTAFEAILTIKGLETFGSKAMLGRIVLERVEVSTDSSKEVVFKLVKDATLGETNYQYHEEGESVVIYDTGDHADSLNPGGAGHAIFESQIGATGVTSSNMQGLNIELHANETLTVYAKVVSGAASNVTASLVWKEDI